MEISHPLVHYRLSRDRANRVSSGMFRISTSHPLQSNRVEDARAQVWTFYRFADRDLEAHAENLSAYLRHLAEKATHAAHPSSIPYDYCRDLPQLITEFDPNTASEVPPSYLLPKSFKLNDVRERQWLLRELLLIGMRGLNSDQPNDPVALSIAFEHRLEHYQAWPHAANRLRAFQKFTSAEFFSFLSRIEQWWMEPQLVKWIPGYNWRLTLPLISDPGLTDAPLKLLREPWVDTTPFAINDMIAIGIDNEELTGAMRRWGMHNPSLWSNLGQAVKTAEYVGAATPDIEAIPHNIDPMPNFQKVTTDAGLRVFIHNGTFNGLMPNLRKNRNEASMAKEAIGVQRASRRWSSIGLSRVPKGDETPVNLLFPRFRKGIVIEPIPLQRVLKLPSHWTGSFSESLTQYLNGPSNNAVSQLLDYTKGFPTLAPAVLSPEAPSLSNPAYNCRYMIEMATRPDADPVERSKVNAYLATRHKLSHGWCGTLLQVVARYTQSLLTAEQTTFFDTEHRQRVVAPATYHQNVQVHDMETIHKLLSNAEAAKDSSTNKPAGFNPFSAVPRHGYPKPARNMTAPAHLLSELLLCPPSQLHHLLARFDTLRVVEKDQPPVILPGGVELPGAKASPPDLVFLSKPLTRVGAYCQVSGIDWMEYQLIRLALRELAYLLSKA